MIEKEFYSSIRFPREMSENYKYLFKKTDREILDKYQLEIEGDKVYINVKVMNILFRFTGNSMKLRKKWEKVKSNGTTKKI
jgi:hypothetical protein